MTLSISQATKDYINNYEKPSSSQIDTEIQYHIEAINKIRSKTRTCNDIYNLEDALSPKLRVVGKYEGTLEAHPLYSEINSNYVFFRFHKHNRKKALEHFLDLQTLILEHGFRVYDDMSTPDLGKMAVLDGINSVNKGVVLIVPEHLRTSDEEVKKVAANIVKKKYQAHYQDYLAGLDDYVSKAMKEAQAAAEAAEKRKALQQLKAEQHQAMIESGVAVSLEEYLSNVDKVELSYLKDHFADYSQSVVEELGFKLKQLGTKKVRTFVREGA